MTEKKEKMVRFCNLSLFMLVSRANKILRWRHKVEWTHSPVLSMRQKAPNFPTSFPGSLWSGGERDPGWGWSRVSQNLGDFKLMTDGRGGSVSISLSPPLQRDPGNEVEQKPKNASALRKLHRG